MACVIILTEFTSPISRERENIRDIMSQGDFMEIYVDCHVEDCKKSDLERFCEFARKGEIKNLTGISEPYEKSKNRN